MIDALQFVLCAVDIGTRGRERISASVVDAMD